MLARALVTTIVDTVFCIANNVQHDLLLRLSRNIPEEEAEGEDQRERNKDHSSSLSDSRLLDYNSFDVDLLHLLHPPVACSSSSVLLDVWHVSPSSTICSMSFNTYHSKTSPTQSYCYYGTHFPRTLFTSNPLLCSFRL